MLNRLIGSGKKRPCATTPSGPATTFATARRSTTTTNPTAEGFAHMGMANAGGASGRPRRSGRRITQSVTPTAPLAASDPIPTR
jgi:hypothetical protein